MSMTIAQLKQELTAHGVQLPESSARKEVYEKLYQEFVVRPKLENQKISGTGNRNGGETFSSDDEMELNGKGTGDGQEGLNADETEVPLDPNVVAEVERLSNEEIYNALTSQGENIGPVVASTRQMYKKRLVRLSVGRDTPVQQLGAQAHEDGEYLNGHSDSFAGPSNTSQFSDDDFELETPQSTAEPEEDPVPPVKDELKKLTAEQKKKLEEMLSSSYYSSPVGPSPSTSYRSDSVPKSKPRKIMESEEEESNGTAFSGRIWVIGVLALLAAIYIAYEVFEESRSAAE